MKMPQIEAFFWLACKFRIRDFMLSRFEIVSMWYVISTPTLGEI